MPNAGKSIYNIEDRKRHNRPYSYRETKDGTGYGKRIYTFTKYRG